MVSSTTVQQYTFSGRRVTITETATNMTLYDNMILITTQLVWSVFSMMDASHLELGCVL
jgi:hypothetical protein